MCVFIPCKPSTVPSFFRVAQENQCFLKKTVFFLFLQREELKR